MSVENIVNINESNLQQVLEQSMTTPVLFYFWSARDSDRISVPERATSRRFPGAATGRGDPRPAG